MAERLDLLLFGATGVTGLHAIRYLYKFSKEKKLTWGISGRSETKLKAVLENVGLQIGEDLSKTPIILADIKNQTSLNEMAQKAKVILNCCGPYRLMGFPVVEACIKAGTHHLDVSGEPSFIDSLPAKYDVAAKEKGIYIVSACGVDCLSTDLASTYLQQKFDGVLNSVVAYVEIWTTGKNKGSVCGYGTWQGLIHGCHKMLSISELKRKRPPPSHSAFKPALPRNILPRYSKITKGWLIPKGQARKIMYQTQKYLYEKESQRPFHGEAMMSIPSFFSIFILLLLSVPLLVFIFMVQFPCIRNLLIKYPHIFSCGYVSKEEHPSEEFKEGNHCRVTFYGEGWKEKLANVDEQYTIPPNKSILAKLQFQNCYTFSVIGLIGAGIVILKEKDKLPQSGGVYSPGAAFRKTSLMQMLLDNGTSFEIKSVKDI
ncbi:saccharopine dehydrogenase-like oxidoreductase [Diabrotica virgifera virgifera]|uniref:Saccharopine dehydrogenase NADP binding domain-containing protein n=2 Tax=Diabrotica virgifera virgifera TaxID=50390 RepID=A0ABM5JJ74_DIAVI|nr:saccharopine dehydrogenase-like oxidoreductase [Diabrotica virgifera virgifera]XP_050497991.1 saccharopine dehydrogenase-like oxidoreductase [Diabrotica virgifera virgifera]XP_050497992.1 saccharopine dehydrogenase-like oxidoreductase [Diabrotica virgifera virgifera]